MPERVLSQILELDIDKCQNTFGVSPCTAGRVESGTAQAGAARTITLRAGASAVDDVFVPMTVRIVSGTGAGQERRIGDYVGATKVATIAAAEADFAPAPDATSVYDVINRPNACYNVFAGKSPCQDKPNYVKGTQTLKCTGIGSPIPVGQVVRPYIKNVERAPTRLDPEEGLAVRADTTFTLIDEPDADVETDPYVRDRAAPAGGTYWSRFFARNPNYAGRTARFKQSFVDHGVFGAAVTERYVIDSMKGPGGNGEVMVTLKDPTKLLDKAKAPTPTSGKLAVALGVNDMQLTLGAGGGAQYTSTGWVRVGKTVIRYDGKAGDVLTWSLSAYRAVFGTEVEENDVGSVVQQCLVYDDDAYSAVIEDLYNRAGILDADMDLAGLQAEDEIWLGAQYRVTALISDPESISTLVKELLRQAQAMAWWSPTEQKHKFKVFAPASPSMVVAKTLDETAHLRDAGVEPERLDALRITLCAVYYGLRSATENVKEAKNYRIADLAIDADAESPNEYNGRIPQTFYSRWFGSPNQVGMRTFAQRQVARYRDAPENLRAFSLDPKDGDVAEGQIVDLKSSGLVDAAGAMRTARLLITSRKDRGTHLECSARVTTFDRRYGFIAPAGTANYPNNNGYACVSSAAGLMNDGTQGYLII
jgi:hypothetical protein